MKSIYKGFEIEAKKEKCLAGYDLVYTSIYRVSDLWELHCSYTSNDDVREEYHYLKTIVDNYLANPEDYDD